jgi:hypothetical protein
MSPRASLAMAQVRDNLAKAKPAMADAACAYGRALFGWAGKRGSSSARNARQVGAHRLAYSHAMDHFFIGDELDDTRAMVVSS